jgi:hypothetical protein
LTLTWTAVPGVTLYYVELQTLFFAGPTSSQWQPVYSGYPHDTSLSLTFTWSQFGQWRVCAVGPDGTHGAFSPWWGFIWAGKGSVVGD